MKNENEKVFIHYLDRDDEGKDVNVTGYFEIVKEAKNFLIINTGWNEVKIPYHRIIKIKKEKE